MPVIKDYLHGQMKLEPFSIVNDGTSDTGLKKMNAACALIFDITRLKKGMAVTAVLPIGCPRLIYLYLTISIIGDVEIERLCKKALSL